MKQKIEEIFQLNNDRENLLDVTNRLEKNMHFNVTYLLIIVCAVLIADLGLLTNSIMTVVGAKLISPILSPTLSVGFAIVHQRKEMLKTSFFTIFKTLIVGSILSTCFYLIFKVDEINPIIQGYATPTLLGVFIALVAGFIATIATNKKNKINILPGVAVAVSLVPPLAVIGLGISTLDFKLAIGALLVYLTYTFFISCSSLIVFYLLDINKIKATLFSKIVYKFVYILLVITLISLIILFNVYYA